MNRIITILLLCLIFTSCSMNKTDIAFEKHLLIDTDKAFSQLSEDQGMNQAFLSYCDTNAVLLRKKSMPVQGINAIRERLSLPDTAFYMTWEPLFADVSESADLGYTYGIYRFYFKSNPDSMMKGTYVSVWKKNDKGEWKFVLDSGNEGLE